MFVFKPKLPQIQTFILQYVKYFDARKSLEKLFPRAAMENEAQ